jgi:iron complex transport system ATP-binding protein
MRRDDTVMLADLSWEVRAGEHWAMLGSNGAGKTSLINVLMAYEHPSSGQVEVLAQRFGAADWRAMRRRIGVVSSALHAHTSDSERAVHAVASGKFAAFGPWSEPSAADLDRAAQILADMGAAAIADRPWRVLSQGERQRVLIGRALMADPEVLLLDEACAGLDPVARERLLAVVGRLARARPAVVLVTHHIEEIIPAITHVLVLRRGRVAAAGPKEEVLTSAVLGAAFEHPVTVRRRGERYEIEVAPTPP